MAPPTRVDDEVHVARRGFIMPDGVLPWGAG
jgi:hypothetical protein